MVLDACYGWYWAADVLAEAGARHMGDYPKGLVVTIPRSKTDPYRDGQLVVLPHSSRPEGCSVVSLWGLARGGRIGAELERGNQSRGGLTCGRVPPRARQRDHRGDPGMREAAINNAVQGASLRALGPEGRAYSGRFAAGWLRNLRLPSEGPRIGPSPLRPATASWPRWTSTSGWRAHGRTTPTALYLILGGLSLDSKAWCGHPGAEDREQNVSSVSRSFSRCRSRPLPRRPT